MSEIYVNNYLIKKPYSLIHYFTKIDGDIIISGDLMKLFELLDINDSKIKPENLVEFLIENRKNIRSILKYISNNKSNIDLNRLNKFIKYRSKNRYDVNSEVYLKLMYGEEKGPELFKKQQEKFKKYYDVNYYIGLGLSKIEAENKIREYKDNKSTKLSNFIKKYGEFIGTKKYNEYVDKSKNTIENFKNRYGENWEEKWKNYTSKDSSSFNWAIKKSKGDLLLAEKIFNDKTKKTTVNLEYLQRKYGKEDGVLMYNNINKNKDSASINHFIKKYGDNNIALKEYKKLNNKKDNSSLKYFKEKYGDQGNEKYKKKCELSDCRSLNYFITKHGNVEVAKEYYKKTQEKIRVKMLKASKESLKYFEPLLEYLINNNITSKEDIFIGLQDRNEFFIRESDNLFFYDFTIKSKKIIIEFNGKAWHPNWEKYGIDECIKKFKNKNINAIEAIDKDIFKINLAKENGYDVLVLWEEDGFDVNSNKIKLFLKEKQINYEN